MCAFKMNLITREQEEEEEETNTRWYYRKFSNERWVTIRERKKSRSTNIPNAQRSVMLLM